MSGAIIALVSLAGVAAYVWGVRDTYAVADWLAWPVLTICAWTALLNLAWLSLGHLLLVRVFRERELPMLETLVMSVALGVTAFTQIMYVAGALHLFGRVFAPVVAVLMVGAGAPDLWRLVRRYLSERHLAPAMTPWVVLLTGVGGACVGIVYLGVLTPDAINYDASWSHLTIAQDYAREGRIVAFPADYYKSLPHLASIVHTWSFLVPGLIPQLHWMLALHQEFALFLWTLAGVTAACRWMCDDQRLSGAWVGFFLFPIIFVYDHNLGGAADHVAAFFALPILLATGRFWERFDSRRGALLGCLIGALLLTKYQAVYLLLPVGLLFGPRWLIALGRALRKSGGAERPDPRALIYIAGAFVGALALTAAPHFLKNAIFYHNPVYPFMQRVFASRPTVANAAFLFENNFTDINWVPKGTAWQRLKHAFELSQTFSFVPHYSFTKNFPVFGSLFTLLFPIIPFVQHRGRIALGALLGFVGLLTWGYTFNVDRNLQVLMPIFAAVTCALIVDGFRKSRLAALGLVPLVALQIIWGGDALFYSSYDRIRSAMDLIRSGYEGRAKTRFDQYRDGYVKLGKRLPPNATVLLHSSHVNLGIDRRLYLDWAGFQGLVDYSGLRTPRDAYDFYRRLGITHLLFLAGERPAPTLQEEVVYDSLVHDLGGGQPAFSGYRLVDLSQAPPPPRAPLRVATIGVTGYGSGVFAVEHLNTNVYLLDVRLRVYAKPDSPLPQSVDEAREQRLDAIVVGAGSSIPSGWRKYVDRNFAHIWSVSGHYSLYVPRPPE
jgi:hypothetical protein